MAQSNDNKYYIDYNDFKSLLDSGGWALSMGKEGWTAQRHVDSISNIINYNADIQLEFIIDCELPKLATKIDVYITNDNQDANFPSEPKHYQFIRTK